MGGAVRRPGVRLGALTLVLAAVALAIVPAPVSAHAILMRTDPVDGIVLERAPRTLELWFSEAILLDESSFRLVDADAQDVPLASLGYGTDHADVRVALPVLASSTFRLAWRTVSEDDLHVAAGTIVFGLAGPSGGGASGLDAAVRIDDVLFGWLGLVAYAGLLGALAVWSLLPSTSTGPTRQPIGAPLRIVRRRLLALGATAAVLGVGVGVAILVADTVALGPARVPDGGQPIDLLGTAHGLRVLAMTGFMALAAIACVGRWRVERREVAAQPGVGTWPLAVDRRWLGIGAVAAVAYAWLRVLNGHAGGQDLSVAATIPAVVHTAAASLWVGGLAALALTVVPLVGRVPAWRSLAVGILQRFGRLAAVSLAAVMVTGLVEAGGSVPSPDALLSTAYGRVLLLKVGLAIGVVTIGLVNHLSLHRSVLDRLIPRLAWPAGRRGSSGLVPARLRDRLRTLVPAEAFGALGLVFVAAVLAVTPPAVGQRHGVDATGQSAVEPATGAAADLLVSVVIRPNRPGRNFVDVAVFDTRRPAPGVIGAVTGRFVPPATPTGEPIAPIERTLTSLGDGQYETTIDLPAEGGPWQVSIAAARVALPIAAFTTRWTLLAGPSSADGSVSRRDRPMAPVLDAVAALIAVVLVAVSVGAMAWRRRHAPDAIRRRATRAAMIVGKAEP